MTTTSHKSCSILHDEYEKVFDVIKKNENLPDHNLIIEVGDDWHSENGRVFSKPCGYGHGVRMYVEINSEGDIFFEIEPDVCDE